MDSSWITCLDAYIQRYGWQLMDRDEFVRLVQNQIDQRMNVNSAHAAILCVYSRALYQSCSGEEGRLRQEHAYSELTIFLEQIAARRYGAVRADATQGALERIYHNFARCRQPETFLAFALQKLRDAARVEFRLLRQAEAHLSLDTEVEDSGWQVATTESDPVGVALQNDARRRLVVCAQHFMQEHPRAAHQLAVIWLRYISGLDNRTIAKQLDKTTSAVQVLGSRGMARLRCDPDLRALAAELGFTAPHIQASI